MFGISGIEFLFIALLALIIFGPDKLPQFGRTIGQILRQFNEAKDQVEHMVRTEMYAPDEKGQSPFETLTTPFAATAAKPKSSEAPKPAAAGAADFADDEEEEEEE